MRRLLIVPFLALFAFLLPSAQAQDENGCQGNYVEYAQCLVKIVKQAKADLSETYQSVKQERSPDDRASLIKSQRAWITYRDAECNAEYALSSSRDFYHQCIIRLTRQRTAELVSPYGECRYPPPSDWREPPVVAVPIDLRSLPWLAR